MMLSRGRFCFMHFHVNGQTDVSNNVPTNLQIQKSSLVHLQYLPSGYLTWTWNIPYEYRFVAGIIYKWVIFHGYVK